MHAATIRGWNLSILGLKTSVHKLKMEASKYTVREFSFFLPFMDFIFNDLMDTSELATKRELRNAEDPKRYNTSCYNLLRMIVAVFITRINDMHVFHVVHAGWGIYLQLHNMHAGKYNRAGTQIHLKIHSIKN